MSFEFLCEHTVMTGSHAANQSECLCDCVHNAASSSLNPFARNHTNCIWNNQFLLKLQTLRSEKKFCLVRARNPLKIITNCEPFPMYAAPPIAQRSQSFLCSIMLFTHRRCGATACDWIDIEIQTNTNPNL
jgi:hypothetical protein